MKFLNMIKNLFFRTWMLYLCIGIALYFLVNIGAVKARTLSYLFKPIDILISHSTKKKIIDRAELLEYVNYYQTFVEYIPKSAAAHGMLGFSYYHMGEKDKALSYYQQAVKIHPHFFWFYYNLGVLSYEKGEYEEAISLLLKALDTRPKVSALFIMRSPAFQYENLAIKVGQDQMYRLVTSNLDLGQQKAYKLIILNYMKLNAYGEVLKNALIGINLNTKDNVFFFKYAGLAAYHLNLYGDSVKFLQQAVTVSPKDYDINHYLSLSLDKLDKPQLAGEFRRKIEVFDLKRDESFDDKYILQIY